MQDCLRVLFQAIVEGCSQRFFFDEDFVFLCGKGCDVKSKNVMFGKVFRGTLRENQNPISKR